MIYGTQKMHSPRALAPRGGAPLTGLATPPPKGGLCSFCLPPPAKGLAPEWVVRGGPGGNEKALRAVSEGFKCLEWVRL